MRVRQFSWIIVISYVLAGCGTNQPADNPPALDTAPAAPTESLQAAPSPASVATATLSVPTATPMIPEIGVSGLEIHGMDGLPLAGQAGLSWLRRNGLLWSEVEPEQGQRQWDRVAYLEGELQAYFSGGYQTILVVRSTPGWAQELPGIPCGPIAEESLQAFASFMADAVERYSQPPYNVHYYELWNEPDVDADLIPGDSQYGCWGDSDDTEYYGGGTYAEMLRVVYPQIKAADPQAQVLVGGLLMDCDPVILTETFPGSGVYNDCTPSRFLEGVLEAGGGDYFDGVSFHAYDYYQGEIGHYSNSNWHSAWDTTGPSMIAKVRYLRSLLAAYGYTGKILINTENALLCGRDGSEDFCQEQAFQDTKASYLVQSYTMARVEGLTAIIWYDLHGWRGSGLVDEGGAPLPAYEALSGQVTRLEHAAAWGRVTDGLTDGVRAFLFNRVDGWVWVVWAVTDQPQAIHLSSLPQGRYLLNGASVTPAQDIQVTTAPLYLEWASRP